MRRQMNRSVLYLLCALCSSLKKIKYSFLNGTNDLLGKLICKPIKLWPVMVWFMIWWRHATGHDATKRWSVSVLHHAYPDNIAEAAHQRAGSGSCGHPRRSRQRTGGESANWLCSGPAPAEPSLPPSCQQRAGSGPAPGPDSAGASRIAAGLFPSHLLTCAPRRSIVLQFFWHVDTRPISPFLFFFNSTFYSCIIIVIFYLMYLIH